MSWWTSGLVGLLSAIGYRLTDLVGAPSEIWGCHYDKTIQPPLRAMEKSVPLARSAGLTHREACHWILSRPRAPYESSSFATPQAVAEQSFARL